MDRHTGKPSLVLSPRGSSLCPSPPRRPGSVSSFWVEVKDEKRNTGTGEHKRLLRARAQDQPRPENLRLLRRRLVCAVDPGDSQADSPRRRRQILRLRLADPARADGQNGFGFGFGFGKGLLHSFEARGPHWARDRRGHDAGTAGHRPPPPKPRHTWPRTRCCGASVSAARSISRISGGYSLGSAAPTIASSATQSSRSPIPLSNARPA